jgi:hypothetical protein
VSKTGEIPAHFSFLWHNRNGAKISEHALNYQHQFFTSGFASGAEEKQQG